MFRSACKKPPSLALSGGLLVGHSVRYDARHPVFVAHTCITDRMLMKNPSLGFKFPFTSASSVSGTQVLTKVLVGQQRDLQY